MTIAIVDARTTQYVVIGAGAEIAFAAVAQAQAAAASAAASESAVEALVEVAAGYVEQITGVYDPIAEFVGGAVGAYAVPELEYLFTDTAGTIPATAAGDVIKCWKPKYTTSTNYEQIQADSAKAPILRKMGQLWYLDYANGKGMYSRANVPLKCPQQILCAGSFGGTLASAFFGYVKNTNAAHYLRSETLDRVGALSNGASDLARPTVTATTADYSSPIGAIAVHHSALLPASINSKMELGLDKAGNSPLATAWANADTIAGMSLAINCTSQSLGIGVPNASASCKCFGWMVIDREFVNLPGVIEYFQQYTQIEMRDDDLSVFMLTDSTGDDQTVTPEIPKYFAINGLVADHPTKDVFYRIWNRLSDCYTGYQPLTPGDRTQRVFMTVAASAGSQPSYFTADRFDRVAAIHHVNERIVGHGHNMPVTDATAAGNAQAGLLRLGEFIEMEDQLRARWPNAPVLMQKAHPYRLDNRITPVWAAQDLLQNEIYRDLTFARIDLAFEATGRDPLLYQGDGVHMTAAGVTLAGDTQIAAYRAWVKPGTVTPPVLARRRIPASEMVIPNGLFEDWTGALPVGLTLTGGTVTKSTDEQLRGPSLKLVAAASGDSFVQWDFDPVPYQGQTVVLTLWQLIKAGGDQETGRIQAGSNGTGNVGNSWLFEPGTKSVETWEPRCLHLPIPANATAAFFRMWGGSGATGVVHADRMVTARGIIPRDVLI